MQRLNEASLEELIVAQLVEGNAKAAELFAQNRFVITCQVHHRFLPFDRGFNDGAGNPRTLTV